MLTMPPQEARKLWLWAEPPMPDAAVSGRAATATSPAKEVRSIAPETKRSPWRAGACGNKSEPFWRRWALRIMVRMAWRGVNAHADEDQPPLTNADRSTARLMALTLRRWSRERRNNEIQRLVELRWCLELPTSAAPGRRCGAAGDSPQPGSNVTLWKPRGNTCWRKPAHELIAVADPEQGSWCRPVLRSYAGW